MTWTEDGGVIVPVTYKPTTNFCKIWKPHPTKQNVWLPNFVPCTKRELQVVRMECGKLNVNYYCLKLNVSCSVSSCKACNEQEP